MSTPWPTNNQRVKIEDDQPSPLESTENHHQQQEPHHPPPPSAPSRSSPPTEEEERLTRARTLFLGFRTVIPPKASIMDILPHSNELEEIVYFKSKPFVNLIFRTPEAATASLYECNGNIVIDGFTAILKRLMLPVRKPFPSNTPHRRPSVLDNSINHSNNNINTNNYQSRALSESNSTPVAPKVDEPSVRDRLLRERQDLERQRDEIARQVEQAARRNAEQKRLFDLTRESDLSKERDRRSINDRLDRERDQRNRRTSLSADVYATPGSSLPRSNDRVSLSPAEGRQESEGARLARLANERRAWEEDKRRRREAAEREKERLRLAAEKRTLWISNLSELTLPADVKFGLNLETEISEIDIQPGETQGLIHFLTAQGAANALRNHDQAELDGSIIRLEWAPNPQPIIGSVGIIGGGGGPSIEPSPLKRPREPERGYAQDQEWARRAPGGFRGRVGGGGGSSYDQRNDRQWGRDRERDSRPPPAYNPAPNGRFGSDREPNYGLGRRR